MAEHAVLETRARGAHRHDGFFARLTLGPGFGVSGAGDRVDDGAEIVFAGGGWTASIDVGGSRGDNLAIFGRLRGAWLIEPRLWIEDEKLPNAETRAFQGLAGAGIAYFLMPLNMYLGAAVGLTVITATGEERDGPDIELDSTVGIGLDLELGKEWWVAADWGLGLALRASFASAEDRDDGPFDTAHGAMFLALLVSATYQ